MGKNESVLTLTLALFASILASKPATFHFDIYPKHQVALSLASVRLRIIVEPDSRNRMVSWAYESEDYSAGSLRQLDGASAPRTITLLLKDLPVGHYDVVGMLTRIDGQQRISDSFDIQGPIEQ